MKSHTMVSVLALIALSGASGFSTNRFLAPPKSSQQAKEDAMQMWAVADMELNEAKSEEREARNGLADGKAIEQVAADTAKVEEARAKKELKGQDLDAALAVARDEKARKLKDAKQMEDVATKEQKDAADTKTEGAHVREDATAIETAAMPAKKVENEVDSEKADAKQLKMVAEIEEHEAAEERVQARDDLADGKAIEKAAAITAKRDEARAAKELSTKNDRDAAVAVAEDQKKREEKDAKQMEDVAAKEAKDAADTMKDATRMRDDAEAIEAVVTPAKKVENEVDTEKADAKQLKMVAEIEEHEASEERVQAREDLADGKAIEKAAAITAKRDEARAAKELSTKSDRDAEYYLSNGQWKRSKHAENLKNDRDAVVAVAEDKMKREDKDAKQIEDVAAKEAKDAEDTMKDATRMRDDAEAIEAVVVQK